MTTSRGAWEAALFGRCSSLLDSGAFGVGAEADSFLHMILFLSRRTTGRPAGKSRTTSTEHVADWPCLRLLIPPSGRRCTELSAVAKKSCSALFLLACAEDCRGPHSRAAIL